MNVGQAAIITQPRFSAAANVGSASAATNIGRNVSRTASNIGRNMSSMASSATESATSFLKGWGGILLVLVILIALFALYYKTIGYYIQLGWDKLGWSKRHGETVEIKVPGMPAATLTPEHGGPEGSASSLTAGASAIGSDIEGAMKRLESDVESALGGGAGGGKQVFNVARNLYTFGEAEPLCRAFGAELATYDQVKEAYEAGADWCNYGWVKGQLAIYPTQKSTYDKLQSGPEHERMSCGLPGVNGGYFPNADQRFGVNCYGKRPVESALDERVQMEAKSDTAFDREVNHFKAELDSIAVNPWNAKQWSG